METKTVRLTCAKCGKELEEGNRVRLSWNEELVMRSGKVKNRTWCGMNRTIYLCRDCSDELWYSQKWKS